MAQVYSIKYPDGTIAQNRHHGFDQELVLCAFADLIGKPIDWVTANGYSAVPVHFTEVLPVSEWKNIDEDGQPSVEGVYEVMFIDDTEDSKELRRFVNGEWRMVETNQYSIFGFGNTTGERYKFVKGI